MRQSERQFDPRVVQAFLSIPEEALASVRLKGANLHSQMGLPESGEHQIEVKGIS